MEYSYEEFTEEFRQLLLAVSGYTEERIYFKEAEEEPRTAGDRLFIICTEDNDKKEVCGVHTRDLYEKYCDGTKMEVLLKDVLEQIQDLKQSGILGRVLEIECYDKVKDSLCVRLLNRKKYAWDLEDAVYKKIGDMALVLYMKIGECKGVLTTMKIRESMMADWNMEVDEIFEKAILNSYCEAPPRIFSWKKWIMNLNYHGEAFMDMVKDYELNHGTAGNCLSTSKKTNGAVAIFYPGVADRIAQLLDDNFYMVFTSVHEVMIHSESESEPDHLKCVLKDTIKKATPEEDFLTNKIYHYDRHDREFSIVK